MAPKTERKLAATQRQSTAQPLDLALLLVLVSMAAMPPVHATSFIIVDGQIVTETQVIGDSESGTLETGGTISTTGYEVNGINAEGTNVTITNSGLISTEGDFSIGIVSGGDSVTITSSGSIGTKGGKAYGLDSFGANAMITNSGKIRTEEYFSGGMVSRGASATITNSGTISTEGYFSGGIVSAGVSATITNSGSISTQGEGAHGIDSFGANATITNSSTISTMGEEAAGIVSGGSSATIINSGAINSVDSGIRSFGASATITNSGTISATRYGISSSGEGATITNSGTISSPGEFGFGIFSDGVSATITNRGTISTKNTGIYSHGASATIINSGNINTAINKKHGIVIFEDSAMINNSGTILTTGSNAHGINATRLNIDGYGNTTITNSGLIAATGSGSYAILGSPVGKETLNLLPGSRIVGAIDLGGGGDTINVYGTSGSAVLNFVNADTINILTPNAVKVGNGTVVTIDPTGESSRAQNLTALSSGIHTVISQSEQTVALMRPVKLAALEMTPGMLNLETAPVAWGQVFGSQSRRGSDGQLLGFEHRYAGLMGGYEQGYRGDRVGLVAGVANGNTSSAMSGMNSDSVFAGLYRRMRHGELRLTASLVAGVERHSSQRTVLDNINGNESARGSTTSFYLSPSVSISRSYVVAPAWELRPSAVLGYSVGWYASYTESGTTNANLTVGARTVQAITGRAQLEMARQTGLGEVSVRAGLQMRQTSQGAVQGTVGGSDFRFSAAGSNNATGSYVGLGVRQVLRERLSLVADVEVGQLSGNEKHVGARVTLQYVF